MTSINWWKQPNQQFITKVVSSIICITFFFPYLTWAFDKTNYPVAISQPGITYMGKKLTVPNKFGTISSSHQAGNKTIISIQDLHCNYEVQKNIAAMIDHFAKNYKLTLVGEEGAFDKIDTGVIKDFPDKKIRQEVADSFVREGKVSGAEYYSITTKRNVQLVGIENKRLYDDSLDYVHSFLNAETQGYIYDVRDQLDDLKAKIYNRQLKKIDSKSIAYRQGEMELFRYAAYIAQLAKQVNVYKQSYTNLAAYLAKNNNNFDHDIDVAKLYQELDKLELAIRTSFYTNEKQKKLDVLYQRLYVMERLLNISVSPEELETFRQEKDQYRVKVFSDFIVKHTEYNGFGLDESFSLLDEHLEKVEAFYQLADDRSLAFVNNLNKKMNLHGQTIAVMVNGGFHAKKVLGHLKAKNFSYMSVKPNLTKQDVINPYFELLQSRQTPLEQLLAKNQDIIKIASRFEVNKSFLTLAELRTRTLALARNVFSQTYNQLHTNVKLKQADRGKNWVRIVTDLTTIPEVVVSRTQLPTNVKAIKSLIIDRFALYFFNNRLEADVAINEAQDLARGVMPRWREWYVGDAKENERVRLEEKYNRYMSSPIEFAVSLLQSIPYVLAASIVPLAIGTITGDFKLLLVVFTTTMFSSVSLRFYLEHLGSDTSGRQASPGDLKVAERLAWLNFIVSTIAFIFGGAGIGFSVFGLLWIADHLIVNNRDKLGNDFIVRVIQNVSLSSRNAIKIINQRLNNLFQAIPSNQANYSVAKTNYDDLEISYSTEWTSDTTIVNQYVKRSRSFTIRYRGQSIAGTQLDMGNRMWYLFGDRWVKIAKEDLGTADIFPPQSLTSLLNSELVLGNPSLQRLLKTKPRLRYLLNQAPSEIEFEVESAGFQQNEYSQADRMAAIHYLQDQAHALRVTEYIQLDGDEVARYVDAMIVVSHGKVNARFENSKALVEISQLASVIELLPQAWPIELKDALKRAIVFSKKRRGGYDPFDMEIIGDPKARNYLKQDENGKIVTDGKANVLGADGRITNKDLTKATWPKGVQTRDAMINQLKVMLAEQLEKNAEEIDDFDKDFLQALSNTLFFITLIPMGGGGTRFLEEMLFRDKLTGNTVEVNPDDVDYLQQAFQERGLNIQLQRYGNRYWVSVSALLFLYIPKEVFVSVGIQPMGAVEDAFVGDQDATLLPAGVAHPINPETGIPNKKRIIPPGHEKTLANLIKNIDAYKTAVKQQAILRYNQAEDLATVLSGHVATLPLKLGLANMTTITRTQKVDLLRNIETIRTAVTAGKKVTYQGDLVTKIVGEDNDSNLRMEIEERPSETINFIQFEEELDRAISAIEKRIETALESLSGESLHDEMISIMEVYEEKVYKKAADEYIVEIDGKKVPLINLGAAAGGTLVDVGDGFLRFLEQSELAQTATTTFVDSQGREHTVLRSVVYHIMWRYFNTNNLQNNLLAIGANFSAELKTIYHNWLEETEALRIRYESAQNNQSELPAILKEADTKYQEALEKFGKELENPKYNEAYWEAGYENLQALYHFVNSPTVEAKKGEINPNSMVQLGALFYAQIALTNITAENLNRQELIQARQTVSEEAGQDFDEQAELKNKSLVQMGVDLKKAVDVSTIPLQIIAGMDFTQLKKPEHFTGLIRDIIIHFTKLYGRPIVKQTPGMQRRGAMGMEFTETGRKQGLVGDQLYRAANDLNYLIQTYGGELPIKATDGGDVYPKASQQKFASTHFELFNKFSQMVFESYNNEDFRKLVLLNQRAESYGNAYTIEQLAQDLEEVEQEVNQPSLYDWFSMITLGLSIIGVTVSLAMMIMATFTGGPISIWAMGSLSIALVIFPTGFSGFRTQYTALFSNTINTWRTLLLHGQLWLTINLFNFEADELEKNYTQISKVSTSWADLRKFTGLRRFFSMQTLWEFIEPMLLATRINALITDLNDGNPSSLQLALKLGVPENDIKWILNYLSSYRAESTLSGVREVTLPDGRTIYERKIIQAPELKEAIAVVISGTFKDRLVDEESEGVDRRTPSVLREHIDQYMAIGIPMDQIVVVANYEYEQEVLDSLPEGFDHNRVIFQKRHEGSVFTYALTWSYIRKIFGPNRPVIWTKSAHQWTGSRDDLQTTYVQGMEASAQQRGIVAFGTPTNIVKKTLGYFLPHFRMKVMTQSRAIKVWKSKQSEKPTGVAAQVAGKNPNLLINSATYATANLAWVGIQLSRAAGAITNKADRLMTAAIGNMGNGQVLRIGDSDTYADDKTLVGAGLIFAQLLGYARNLLVMAIPSKVHWNENLPESNPDERNNINKGTGTIDNGGRGNNVLAGKGQTVTIGENVNDLKVVFDRKGHVLILGAGATMGQAIELAKNEARLSWMWTAEVDAEQKANVLDKTKNDVLTIGDNEYTGLVVGQNNKGVKAANIFNGKPAGPMVILGASNLKIFRTDDRLTIESIKEPASGAGEAAVGGTMSWLEAWVLPMIQLIYQKITGNALSSADASRFYVRWIAGAIELVPLAFIYLVYALVTQDWTLSTGDVTAIFVTFSAPRIGRLPGGAFNLLHLIGRGSQVSKATFEARSQVAQYLSIINTIFLIGAVGVLQLMGALTPALLAATLLSFWLASHYLINNITTAQSMEPEGILQFFGINEMTPNVSILQGHGAIGDFIYRLVFGNKNFADAILGEKFAWMNEKNLKVEAGHAYRIDIMINDDIIKENITEALKSDQVTFMITIPQAVYGKVKDEKVNFIEEAIIRTGLENALRQYKQRVKDQIKEEEAEAAEHYDVDATDVIRQSGRELKTDHDGARQTMQAYYQTNTGRLMALLPTDISAVYLALLHKLMTSEDGAIIDAVNFEKELEDVFGRGYANRDAMWLVQSIIDLTPDKLKQVSHKSMREWLISMQVIINSTNDTTQRLAIVRGIQSQIIQAQGQTLNLTLPTDLEVQLDESEAKNDTMQLVAGDDQAGSAIQGMISTLQSLVKVGSKEAEILKFLSSIITKQTLTPIETAKMKALMAQLNSPTDQTNMVGLGQDVMGYQVNAMVTGAEEVNIGELNYMQPQLSHVLVQTEQPVSQASLANEPAAIVLPCNSVLPEFVVITDDIRSSFNTYIKLQLSKSSIFAERLRDRDGLMQTFAKHYLAAKKGNPKEEQSKRRGLIRSGMSILQSASRNLEKQSDFTEALFAWHKNMTEMLPIFGVEQDVIGTFTNNGQPSIDIKVPIVMSTGDRLRYIALWQKAANNSGGRFDINPDFQRKIDQRRSAQFSFGGAA